MPALWRVDSGDMTTTVGDLAITYGGTWASHDPDAIAALHILANAMNYAVEPGLLETNPIRRIKRTAPRVASQVDRRSVVNPRQARALLEAVHGQQPSGPRLVAFFAVMYYAGLRPEEAINLGRDNVILQPRAWDEASQQWRDTPDDDDWGELHIRSATPDAGSEWTDDGSPRE